MLFKSAPAPSSLLTKVLGETWSPEEIAHLDRLSTQITLPAGAVLTSEGRFGREVMVILSGSAAVSRGDEVLATVGAGGMVGEQAVLTNGRRNADVIATSDLTAAVMSVQEFNSLLHDCPRVEKLTRWLMTERKV